MLLKSFRVTNFRSINDSGEITVAQVTAMLGRNESGKSNLLRALHSVNPSEGFRVLNPIKDFPRHRRLEECADTTPVVSSTWLLSDTERAELGKLWPNASDATEVTIERRYDAIRTVEFSGISVDQVIEAEIRPRARKVAAAVKAAAERVEEPKQEPLTSAADAYETSVSVVPDRVKWAAQTKSACAGLRKALAVADAELTEKQEQILLEIEELASRIEKEKDAQSKARAWVVAEMPIFMYLDEYPELNGHQNISEYINRKQQNAGTDADRAFDRLCKVAGLAPEKLQSLLANNDPETRNQLVNRAGAVVTGEIRRLWKDRSLKIRFNLDAQHLDTFISDPNATYDVEVNLAERSRGFQWFFAFYIAFAADTNGGKADGAILLLDEPGLYLHARSQSDLLRHFVKDFNNQILFTTHSPFMVPTDALDSVRTVNIDGDAGTTVSNDPTGDSRTLFPLQAALGYNLAQSLFVGGLNLVVEGVTDYWVLAAVSAHLAETGGVSLAPEFTITPAGGAQKISYLAALLSSEKLGVIVLLDQEKEALGTKDELVKTRLLADDSVMFISEAFGIPPPTECDLEDLFDPTVYESLVTESFKAELAGRALKANSKIPRVAKRMDAALSALGITFHKTRPAKLFLNKMATSPSAVLPETSKKRFEQLFERINVRMSRAAARRTEPFR